MEDPQVDNQAILDTDDDHVQHDRLYDKMISAAETGEDWQEDWEAGAGQHVDSFFLQQDPLQTQTMRAGKPRSPIRRQMGFFETWQYLFLLMASLWIIPASAVLVDFQNCLSEDVQNNTPLQLQLVPLVMNAVFNTTDPMHNLNITVWTNVTGSTVELPRLLLPPANDSYWTTPNDTEYGGKIENDPFPSVASPVLTTLFNKVSVLTYTPVNPHTGVGFCDQLVNGSCPLSPNFNDNL